MPPLPRLRMRAMRDLAEQLRFAPRQAVLRHLDRAESLAAEIAPAELYAEDWLVWRITGYRPAMQDPAQLLGEAVVSDLSALVERLCVAVSLGIDDLDDTLTADELAGSWGVSRKTIDRYRRAGLIARRVRDANGRTRLVFRRAPADRFRDTHAREIERAHRYSRLDDDARRRIIRRAQRYRTRLRWSLNETARRLAERHGRSHEAIRQILLRHDEHADRPIFGERGPMSARERALALRATDRGVDVSRIAARLNRSAPTVRRGINLERLARLERLDLDGPAPGWFDDPDAESRALAPAPVCATPTVAGETDLLRFVREAREVGAPLGAEEHARAIAHAFLRHRAHTAIHAVSRTTPQAHHLDRAETDLRWAARLKTELVRSQLPLLVRTLEARLGCDLERVRTPVLLPLIEASLHGLSGSVDEFDPESGGRLAARAGLAIDRAAQRVARDHARELDRAQGRAAPRLVEGIAMPDWTRRVAPWQAWLEPPERVLAVLDELDEPIADLLRARYGIGQPPATAEEVCERFGISRVGFSRAERRALRSALERARARALGGSEP